MASYKASDKRYESMKYNRCGKSGLLLPAVSLGLWHNFGTNDSFENMTEMCRTAFDLGITHFDLANNYGPIPGSAEENFGKILKNDFRNYRDELIVSTKAGYDMWKGPYGNFLYIYISNSAYKSVLTISSFVEIASFNIFTLSLNEISFHPIGKIS